MDAIIKAGNANEDAPQSVLFVCTMNVIRSPMASAIARTLYPKQIYFRSAGAFSGENDPFVKSVMNEANVDISTHNPKTYDELEDEHFDLIITLTSDARDRIAEITGIDVSEIELWELPDPTLTNGSRDQKMDAYRAVRDELARKIKQRFGWQE